MPEMETVAIEVLRSGKIANGEYVGRFEAGIGKIIGQAQAHVVSTIDMTSAIFLALYLADVRKDSEVLTTAFACMSTNSAIAQCGATPVWVDVKAGSVEMDVADLIKKITPQTKAVIVYHVAGYPTPTKAIAEICQQRGITLIEDCDNALSAYQGGVHVGFYADFSIYSFYPNRQINATEGGALVCKSLEMASRARRLRRFGIDAATFRNSLGELNPASDIPEVGWAFTMNNLCAALGCTQLNTVGDRAKKVRENVAQLISTISGFAGVRVLLVPADSQPDFWVLLLLVENKDIVLRLMKEQGVSASSVHQRNDMFTGFKKSSLVELPNTGYLQSHILAIPCGWWLSNSDLQRITDALRKATLLASAP